MKIRLDEIPDEGKSYSLDEKSKELKGSFEDLKLDRFNAEVKIRPLDSFFELSGTISSMAHDVCGVCGFDIDLEVKKSVSDMILPKPVDPRGSRYSKGFTVEESSSVDVVYHEQGVFDLGEYLHEAVALGMPLYPTCQEGGCPRSEETQDRVNQINVESEKFGQKTGKGFDALKNLKL